MLFRLYIRYLVRYFNHVHVYGKVQDHWLKEREDRGREDTRCRTILRRRTSLA